MSGHCPSCTCAEFGDGLNYDVSGTVIEDGLHGVKPRFKWRGMKTGEIVTVVTVWLNGDAHVKYKRADRFFTLSIKNFRRKFVEADGELSG